MWPFGRRTETRADLGQVIGDRAIEIASAQDFDMARLSVAEACAGVYGRCFAAATVEGAPFLTPDIMAMIGRALLFRGEFVGALTADGNLIPAQSSDVLGESPDPMEWGYRLHYAVPRGTGTMLAPAEAVLHVRVGAMPGAPWRGRSPLAGAMADAELAMASANAIRDEARTRPLRWVTRKNESGGLGMPAEQVTEMTESLRRLPTDRRAVVSGALETGRDQPKPDGALNDARRTAATEIAGAAGVPRALLDGSGDGAAAREGYRRLTRATISPLGRLVAHEASAKTGVAVKISFEALRASDTAMAARAFAALTANGVPVADALAIAGLSDER